MRLFTIRGGVHPEDRKALSAGRPIEVLPIPKLLHIPLQQHIGAIANPLVQRRQYVAKGERIAHAQGAVSAPIHAPTSGRIVGLGLYPANHPSGLSVRTITLQPDGKDRWHKRIEGVADPFALEPAEIAQRVADAGVVGLGGATFPSAVKLGLGKRYALSTLVINGSECEPYLTCDDQLMREQAEAIVDGARLMARALGVERILFGIEGNKPEALAAVQQATAAFDGVEVVRLPMRYPMGSEKHLVQTLTGKETPARGLTADIGVVVHNPATAFAVYEALRFGQPLVSRVISVTGGAISAPKNLRVLIGTKIEDLVEHCSRFREEPARLIAGGPMMGQPIPELRVPVMKGTNGILALTAAETGRREPAPCIRCGSCVQACPCGLLPLAMAAQVRAGDLDAAVSSGLMDCIGCGSCAYVCPAHLPLVQCFNHAKGELAARGRAKQKQTETKRLAEHRAQRLEAQKRAKREAMAKRKREADLKKQAEAAADSEGAAASTPAAAVEEVETC
ncbi:electron transport complex subunit RsxC [Halochromatium salexigens]|uniref:Ion-translocating oxidoreductase complex subunit C n=1 Tax=Halochromatium salexigens TaxID=49447 RepID=A0AAJ0UKS6_HALSE|nr:electron transport complex subunit RsxC [Halochromatium salexigens]MBK5931987.1 electron transport complex subunit RsxC [Halochromatium salexigens]